DDLHGLGEPLHLVVERDAECPVLRLMPARTEAEGEPPVAQLLQGVRDLRGDDGLPETGAGDQDAQADAGRLRGDGGEHRPRLPGAGGRAVGRLLYEQVVEGPYGVEAGRLDLACERDELGGRRRHVRPGVVAHGQYVADAHAGATFLRRTGARGLPSRPRSTRADRPYREGGGIRRPARVTRG